jgi:hypothetical protein
MKLVVRDGEKYISAIETNRRRTRETRVRLLKLHYRELQRGTTAIKRMPRAANCAPVDSPSPKSRPIFASRAYLGGCSMPRGRGAAQNAWPDTFPWARRRKTALAAAPVNTSTLKNPSSAPRAAAVATKPRRARACARKTRRGKHGLGRQKNVRRRAMLARMAAWPTILAARPAGLARPASTPTAMKKPVATAGLATLRRQRSKTALQYFLRMNTVRSNMIR